MAGAAPCVEVDSREFHDTPAAFEADRAKDRALAGAGWRVARVTRHAMTADGSRTAADLHALLALGHAPPPPRR